MGRTMGWEMGRRSNVLPKATVKKLALALAVAGVCGWGSMASAATPASQPSDNAALLQKVNQLENRVNELEAQQTTTAKKQQADDDAAAAAAVLHEADTQTNLLSYSTPMLSGYDPNIGFVLRSDDGLFSMRPDVLLDFREMTSDREKIPPTAATGGGGVTAKTGYDIQSGFDATRVRFVLSGNYTSQFTYFFQIQDDQGAGVGLLDAYGLYKFGDGPFYAKFGQFKDPVWHERNLSETSLLAVDRSYVETLVGGGQTSRVQGAGLVYDQDRFRGQVIYHDGFNSINTPFYDAGGEAAGLGAGAGVTPTDYGGSARAEYLLVGARDATHHPFAQYDSGFTALGAKQDIVVVGGGADYSEANSNNVLFHSADITYQGVNGLSLYGAYLASYRSLNTNQGVAPGHYYDYGALIQAGYLVTPKFEPFVRYDYTYLPPDSLAPALGIVDHSVNEITVGANYYLYHQNLKMTVDASWLPNGAPADSTALGILKDSGQNEFLLRAQFQIFL